MLNFKNPISQITLSKMEWHDMIFFLFFFTLFKRLFMMTTLNTCLLCDVEWVKCCYRHGGAICEAEVKVTPGHSATPKTVTSSHLLWVISYCLSVSLFSPLSLIIEVGACVYWELPMPIFYAHPGSWSYQVKI